MKNSKKKKSRFYCSLALDESNEISDAAEFLIFIRGTDGRFSLYEELTSVSSLHDTTTGDLFMKVQGTLICQFIGTNMGNLKKCNDGRYEEHYAVGRIVSEVMHEISVLPMTIHCIIHQQVLCIEVLKWNSGMDDENGRNRGHFSKYAGGPKSLKRH
jgi:hypothetical protein